MSLITGKQCSLSIGATAFDNVVNRFELSFDMTRVDYQTLDGPKAGPGAESGTLSITAAMDAGAQPSSLFDVLWAAVDAGTPVAYEAVAGTTKWSGNAIAVRPNVQGVAGEVSEFTVEMALDGIPTPAAVTSAQTSGSGTTTTK